MPQQNGVAERMNKTLLERARCMLNQVKLGKHFLAEAVATACYLVNCSPHTALKFKSPQEVWYNTLVNYSSLIVFHCPTYIHVNDEKLEPRSRKYIFVGYGVGVKGYRVWCNGSKRIITSRNVVFNENSMLVSNVEKPIENDVNDVVIDPIDAQEEVQAPNTEEDENDDDVQQRSPPL